MLDPDSNPFPGSTRLLGKICAKLLVKARKFKSSASSLHGRTCLISEEFDVLHEDYSLLWTPEGKPAEPGTGWAGHGRLHTKGQCHDIFASRFFSRIIFPRNPDYPIWAISIFSKNHDNICNSRCSTDAIDANSKRLPTPEIASFVKNTYINVTCYGTQ